MRDLPPGWVTTTLGEICDAVRKHNPAERPDDTIRYIDIGGIEGQRISEVRSLAGRDAPSRARQLVRAGDTVLSTVRTYLRKTALIPPELDGATASTGFCVLRPSAGIDPRFVFYRVIDSAFVALLSGFQTGTSYPAVRNTDVFGCEIGLPPSTEQQRIVAAIEEQFSRLDAAERLLDGVVRRLDQLRRSILTTTIDHSAWERSTVSEIASLVTDGDHNPPPRVPAGIPHLTARNVKRGRLVLEGCSFVSEDGFEHTRARYEPCAGDVIVTCVGTIGQTAVVPSDLQFSADRNLAAIRVQTGVNPRYVQLALSSPASQAMMSGASGSTAQPHLYLRDLRALSLPLPPIALQDRLVEALEWQLSVVDTLAADVERALVRGAALRRSILERAFSGMLVPQDPAEESATVLIGRAAAAQAAEPRPTRSRQALSR